MKLNQKAFNKLKDLNSDLITKSFGENNPSLGCSLEHSNEYNSGKAWDRLLDCDGNNATFPNNTALLELAYDNERGEITVINLSSTILRNAANYYSALADVVEQLEKDTNELPDSKPEELVESSSYFVNLLDTIEDEDKSDRFHMKLNIPGATD
jgi:hypothetical protein